MRAIRAILIWVYAFEAAVCLWPLAVLAWTALARHAGSAPGEPPIRVTWPLVAAGTVFAASSMAYWWKQSAARWWGTAAGALNVAFAGLTVFVLHLLPASQSGAPVRTSGWQLAGIELAAGIAGIVVFGGWKREAEERTAEAPLRIEGDGTHPAFDRLVWVAGFGGFLAAMLFWWRWAHAQGLPGHGTLPWYVEFVIAELATVAVHELGHTLVGRTLGMRVRAFIVGPFQWRVRDGRWGFQFRVSDLLATGGATAVVPTHPQQPRGREICMIAGGPLASLLGGLAALFALLMSPRHAWNREWEFLAIFATLSLLAAVVNLLPFQTRKEQYSDGAQIRQLLSGGPWGDYHHAMGIVGATTVTPLRPRDYDIGALERAAEVITQGPRGLHLRLLISSYYRDCGRMQEAGAALDHAEDIYEDSAAGIPAELHTPFITGKAIVQRDADGAREWWERMKAKKPAHFNADYWLARAALLWIEGRLGEAREAWEKGNTLAQMLPCAGAYEADRDQFALLRKELDGRPAEPELENDLLPVA